MVKPFQRLRAPRLAIGAIGTSLKKLTNANVVCMMAIERPDLQFLWPCFARVGTATCTFTLPAADGEERQGEEEDGTSRGQG